jgi:hypothetical protein
MWSVTNSAAFRSAGNEDIRALSASSAPAEPPTTIISRRRAKSLATDRLDALSSDLGFERVQWQELALRQAATPSSGP